MKAVLNHDALTGITEVFHHEVGTKDMLIQRVQPTDAIIEANRAEFNNVDRTYGKQEFTKVASIPLTLYMDLRKKGILRDPVAMKKWLNDPDNAAFRTKPGVV